MIIQEKPTNCAQTDAFLYPHMKTIFNVLCKKKSTVIETAFLRFQKYDTMVILSTDSIVLEYTYLSILETFQDLYNNVCCV